MIDALRKKFLIITMSIYTIIFVVVSFGLGLYVYLSNVQQKEELFTMAFEQSEKIPFGLQEERSIAANLLAVTIHTDRQLNIRSIVSFAYVVDTQTAQQLLDAAINQRTLDSFEYRVQADDAGYTFAFLNTDFVLDNLLTFLAIDGGVGLALWLLFLFLANLLIKQTLRPVEEAWQNQKQFLADASHELKTPLTVILTQSELKNDHALDVINQEALRMKKLVEDLLFLARNDAKPNVEKQSLCLSDLVQETLLSMDALAFEKGIDLTSDIQEDIHLTCNQDQIKQLVMILIDNAIKYTPSNHSIRVELKKAAKKIELCVQNTGSYIPPEDQAHLFDRFYRMDKSRKFEGGYGLGLAIAKQITEIHKANISVTSTQDQITTFIVTFLSEF